MKSSFHFINHSIFILKLNKFFFINNALLMQPTATSNRSTILIFAILKFFLCSTKE